MCYLRGGCTHRRLWITSQCQTPADAVLRGQPPPTRATEAAKKHEHIPASKSGWSLKSLYHFCWPLVWRIIKIITTKLCDILWLVVDLQYQFNLNSWVCVWLLSIWSDQYVSFIGKQLLVLNNFSNKNGKMFDGSWFSNVRMFCFFVNCTSWLWVHALIILLFVL